MSTLTDRIRGVLQAPGLKTSDLPPSRRNGPGAFPSDVERVQGSHGEEGSLERVLGGEWRQHDGAGCFVVETRQDPSTRHGDELLGTLADRLEQAAGEGFLLTGSPVPRPLVFFDLETTGLSGGAGTCAFLIGFGWFDEGGAFFTRQYFLVRFSDEPRMLALAAQEMARAGALVSFNGKSFDAPVLETRFLYHRLEWVGAGLPHVDMLHVARRFWRREGVVADSRSSADAGCSLRALEQQVLRARREGDVPGSEIPSRYFHFVRTGHAHPLKVVFEHNRLDLLSLAALTTRALHLVRTGPEQAADPREALALGHVYSRAGFEGRARVGYKHAIDLCAPQKTSTADFASSAIRVEALRALAVTSRRARGYDEAAGYWRQILDVDGCPRHLAREASEALAIHYEHRMRDLKTARTFALRSLGDGARTAWNEAVGHRLTRLDRKIGRLKFELEGSTLACGGASGSRRDT